MYSIHILYLISMVNVSVKTDGIKYLFECLSRYTGNTGYIILFFAMLVFIVLNGTEKEKKIFVPVGITMAFTVYNPLFPLVLSLLEDISSEYYRFFWITPVVVLVPYFMTKIILLLMEKAPEDGTENGIWSKDARIVIITFLIVLFSSGFMYKNGINIADNIYKMPDELIEISEIIHNDCEDEYPKAFLEYEYNMQMRQYDSKMILTIDREDYLSAVSEPIPSDKIYNDFTPQYRLLAAFVRGQQVETPILMDGFELSKTEYVVLTKGNLIIKRLLAQGLTEIAQTENHVILKYNIKERNPFELVDYTEIYENGL